MVKNELSTTPDDTPEAKQAYESALEVLADIVLAYLASEETYPRRTGGIGSTNPYPCAPLAA